MPYITRADGVHFVIPSYRDVLIARSNSALQKEVVDLSQNYGAFITLQRKNAQQYDVAFSQDAGYSLGETVWQYFKRPADMVYCEAVPNSTEAILVIVKDSSVYLDGSFPIESIPEELIIFLTQQNNFEIYISGDVPISEKPVEGKFSFDGASVKSFSVLPEPIFSKLPLLPAYHFQLVDTVLKENGIGVFPIKALLNILMVIGGVIGLYYLATMKPREPDKVVMEPNPYQVYVDALASPAPDEVVAKLVDRILILYSIPGWSVTAISYKGGGIQAKMRSDGSSVSALQKWCRENGADMGIITTGIIVNFNSNIKDRIKPKQIYPKKDVLINFIDNIATVYPGNNLRLSESKITGPFTAFKITLDIKNSTPVILNMIGSQLRGLPFAVSEINLTQRDLFLFGTITLDGFGT